MSGLVREVLNTLRPGAARSEALARESEALARLDERLGGLAPAQGTARCARTIRPDDCVAWPGNLTDRSGPTADACRALIDSIAEEGGNLVPVVVRPLPAGSDHPFELLVGNRRRFAVDWLNRNGRPEIRLNALVVDLDDEEAFRLADIENREREDIAELDRARSYRRALGELYAGVQSRMAEALRLSNSQLSRLLALAELPDELVSAFASEDELRVRHSEILTPLLRRPEAAAMIAEARRIGAEQEQLCAASDKLIPAAAVLARLREAGAEDSANPVQHSANSPGAAELGTIEAFPGGIAVELVVPEFADIDEVLGRLKQALIECRREARSAEDEDRYTLR
ncbi:MAG: ParB/RepB/Spo0J family partition protein [Novosphingobium sp.]|nr:ParB/RepB/Spo0J family partition protein [Novosphingobium sp.]